MSDVSSDELRRQIQAVLKDADLSTISAKRVREQVESKLNCSLLNRKKEFDKIVMEVINEQQQDSDGSDPDADPESASEPSEEEDPSSSEEEKEKNKKKPAQKKRPQPTKHKVASKKKRKSINADDSGTESDGGSDSDYQVPKKVSPKKKAKAGTGRKGTGFTRAYNLSPELSALMGETALPRHEVVKKVWAIIKERDLYDPKNKQFAICDDELMKVMKVKRFRTFGMLKHLKPHFLD